MWTVKFTPNEPGGTYGLATVIFVQDTLTLSASFHVDYADQDSVAKFKDSCLIFQQKAASTKTQEDDGSSILTSLLNTK